MLIHAMTRMRPTNAAGHTGIAAYTTYPTSAMPMNAVSAARRPYRSATQPPGYWYAPSRKSLSVPYRPIAGSGAPRRSRYFGMNRFQSSSPNVSVSVAIETATTLRSKWNRRGESV
jgi:hypothetical protein